jgi:Fe-Mn family superoxide dismutase
MITTQGKTVTYTAKDFSHLIGIEGISETMLKNHFKLYQGYVTNTNELLEKIQSEAPEGKPSPEFSELTRRLGFEFCGMRLHEYYFGNLTKGGKKLNDSLPLAKKLEDKFGDFDTWQKNFIAVGSMRGVGWAILYYDVQNDNLINVWVNEHQVNNLPGCTPILVMDVWEHAFMLDYQLDRASYIKAFMQGVNWEEVNNRFVAATKIQP